MLVSLDLVLLLLAAQLAAGFEVEVTIGLAHAATNVSTLTSVTMDICLAKQRFDFTNPQLLALTQHLGGGGAVLRVGGTDQNTFYYDLNSTQHSPYSASTGAPCCPDHGSCKGCVKDCTMPSTYWRQLTDFAAASGHALMFGLVPDIQQAVALVNHSAEHNVFAFTFGNEVDSQTITDGYPVLRRLLDDASLFPGSKPVLAGPDVALQRHASIEKALADDDPSVHKKLAFVENFTSMVGRTLDVVSWHTYDFETADLGMTDHHTLLLSNETHRFWNTSYLDLVLRLLDNMTNIAAQYAPGSQVWLTESDSVCHQGIDGLTNAYLNGIWLVNRLCVMANANVSMMARQSLIGYNYSLLGNWPVEQIQPNPDYFTTVLFRRLFGDSVLDTTAAVVASASGRTSGARAFAFCAALAVGGKNGSVSIALLNFDQMGDATFRISQKWGELRQYLLQPGGSSVVPDFRWSSRQMLLNGELLEMKQDGSLPAVLQGPGKPRAAGVVVSLPPLSVCFVVLPNARHESCY